jgi:hypothetical protein
VASYPPNPPPGGPPGPPYQGGPPPYQGGPPPYQGGPTGSPAGRPQPQSIKIAVLLMYVGAGLEVLGALLSIASRSAIRRAVAKAALHASTPINITRATNVALAFVVVVGIIAAGLWVWMAAANGAGKIWARVTATVFWGLNFFFLILDLFRPNAAGAKIFAVVIFLVGAGVIFLLWRPESSDFFNPPYQSAFG